MTAYSQNFLAAIGLIAVQWAKIEHELKWHTSALASQDTDGWPMDGLEFGFTKVRKLWLRKIREHIPEKHHEAERIASNLATLAEERAVALHGRWRPTKKVGRYAVNTFRQKKGRERERMELGEEHATPKELRAAADEIADAYDELRKFIRAEHRP